MDLEAQLVGASQRQGQAGVGAVGVVVLTDQVPVEVEHPQDRIEVGVDAGHRDRHPALDPTQGVDTDVVGVEVLLDAHAEQGGFGGDPLPLLGLQRGEPADGRGRDGTDGADRDDERQEAASAPGPHGG